MTASKPKQRLVVRHRDGREASYPLEPGRYVIGSAAACPIRIEAEGVAAEHAQLVVDEQGVSVVNLQTAGSLQLDEAPAPQGTPVAVVGPMRLGTVQMELVPVVEAEGAIEAESPDGAGRLHEEISRDMRMALQGYREFQKRIAPQISPTETAAARTEFNWSRRAFGIGCGVWALCYCLMCWIPGGKGMREVATNVVFLLGIVLALIAVSWFRIPFAGRLLVPLVYVLCIMSTNEPRTWGHDPDLFRDLLLFGVLPLFGLGALFDYGAATQPNRSRRTLRRLSLMLFGLVWLGFMIADRSWMDEPAVCVFPVPFVICCIWPWWPGRRLERWQARLAPDVWEVLQTAFIRWRRWVRGRTMALLLGLLPFFLFLNLLGLRERLELAEDSSVLTREYGGSTNVWFCPILGRLLRAEDFSGSVKVYNKVYPFEIYLATDEKEFRAACMKLWSKMGEGTSKQSVSEMLNKRALHQALEDDTIKAGTPVLLSGGSRAFSELKTMLNQFHIATAEQFKKGWPADNAKGLWTRCLWLGRYETQPAPEQKKGQPAASRPVSSVWGWSRVEAEKGQDLYVAQWVNLQYLAQNERESLVGSRPSPDDSRWMGWWRSWCHYLFMTAGGSIPSQSLLYLGYGIVGFIFLWRRGGDSALAFWIGLWLVAWASAGIFHCEQLIGNPFVSSLKLRLSHDALESHAAGLALGALWLVDGINWWTSNNFDQYGLPFCAMLVLLCWPMADSGKVSRWLRWTVNVIIFGLLVAALRLLNEVIPLTLQWLGEQTMPALQIRWPWTGWASVLASLKLLSEIFGGFLSWAALIGLGYWLRQWSHRRLPLGRWAEMRLRAGDVLPWMLTYLGLSVMNMGSPWLALGATVVGPWLRCVGFAVALLTLLWAGVRLLRHNYLGVVSRDVPSILLGAMLPLLFEAANHLCFLVLEDTPFFSRVGAEILGVLLVVLLLKPLWHWIEQMVERLSIPNLHTIQQGVQRALEAVVDAPTVSDKREEVRRLFEEHGVSAYAFYSRGREGGFDLHLSRLSSVPANRLTLSPHLREFLANERTFLDLRKVAGEWGYYFEQFELFDVEQKTRCCYLLPICLGKSLRGLLLLPRGEREDALCKPALADDLGALGNAALYT